MSDLERLRGLFPLPWRTALDAEAGVVFDASGAQVLSVDQWGDLPDVDVHAVATVVVAAVNGFAALATVHASNGEPFVAEDAARDHAAARRAFKEGLDKAVRAARPSLHLSPEGVLTVTDLAREGQEGGGQ